MDVYLRDFILPQVIPSHCLAGRLYPYTDTVTCEVNLHNLKRIKDFWKYQVNRKYNWHLQAKEKNKKPNIRKLKLWNFSPGLTWPPITGSWHLKECLEKAGWCLCPMPICSHTMSLKPQSFILPGAVVITTRHHVKQGNNQQCMGPTFSTFSQSLNLTMLCDMHTAPEGIAILS